MICEIIMSDFNENSAFSENDQNIDMDFDLEESQIQVSQNNSHENFTDDILLAVNFKAKCYEEVFNNFVTYALYQETLTQNSLLYEISKALIVKLQKGYALNLNNSEFIRNIILLYEYSDKDMRITLLEKLPDFLKIIFDYYNAQDVPIHFWLDNLTSKLSIKDLIGVFNLTASEDNDIEKNRLILEPYCVALDAALREYDFDSGEQHKTNIFTNFIRGRAVFLELKRANIPFINDLKKFTEPYPYRYQFLIDAAINIDYGCFLNGVVILRSMLFGGASDYFINVITKLLINEKAYTIPFSNHGVPLPICLPFPILATPLFYTDFAINDV